MKKHRAIGWEGALSSIAVFVLMPGLFAAQTPAKKQPEKAQVVDIETFRVSPPPEGKWKVDMKKGMRTNEVIFTRSREGLLTAISGQWSETVVIAAEVVLEPAAWRLTEEEAAKHVLNGFITREARDWDAPGTVTDEGETVLRDKKLRFAMFRKAYTSEVVQMGDLAIFLYCPPEFKKSHVVFIFEYYFTRSNSGLVKLYKNPGLEPVHAVIDSLEIFDPLEAVPGPGGDLLRAAAVGDAEAARLAINQGASVNTRIPLWTALSTAAFYGKKEVVSLLLEQGADINLAEEIMGATPLHAAIVGGEPEIAASLVMRGADVNLRIKDGSSVLLFAVAQGYDGLVSMLIEKGAIVEAGTGYGETPFMFSADCGLIETARILKAAGADVNAQTKAGETALMFAAARGHAEMAGWLLNNGADCNHQCLAGYTSLWNAVESENSGLAKMLIGAGANVNARTKQGFTALMLAAQYGLADIVRLLIDAGADVNARGDKKTAALRLAKYKKHTEIVKLLKAAGAK